MGDEDWAIEIIDVDELDDELAPPTVEPEVTPRLRHSRRRVAAARRAVVVAVTFALLAMATTRFDHRLRHRSASNQIDPARTVSATTTEPAKRFSVGGGRAAHDVVIYRTRWGSRYQQFGFIPANQSDNEEPRAIAVTPDLDFVYVADEVNSRIVRVNVARNRIDEAFPGGMVSDMVVDPVTGDLLTVFESYPIERFDPQGRRKPDLDRDVRAFDFEPVFAASGVYTKSDDGRLQPVLLAGAPVAAEVAQRAVLPGMPAAGLYARGSITTTSEIALVDQDDRVVVRAQPMMAPGWTNNGISVTAGHGRIIVVLDQYFGSFDAPEVPFRTSIAVLDDSLRLLDVLDLPVSTGGRHTLRIMQDAGGSPVVFALTTDERGAELHRLDWNGEV